MEFLKKYFFNFLDLSALQTDDENQNNKTQNTLEGEKQGDRLLSDPKKYFV